MKKVLEIINLPSSAINFIGGQFKYLRDEGGYEMHLICSLGGGIEEFCDENGVKYHPVQLQRQLSIKQDVLSLIDICRYIKREQIDIVIAHQSKGRLLGMIACALTGVKNRIIFAHGVVYETMSGVKRWLMIQNDRFVSLLADKVVCVSQYVCDKRAEDRIDRKGKRVLLGRGSCNGIDTITKFNPDLVEKSEVEKLREKFGISREDFVIGFCGRLVRDKGIIELVTSHQQIKQRHPERTFKLLIVGEPEKRDALPEETIHYLTHTSDVVFTGLVSFADIQIYYLLMDVLVLPTHREGFGMVAVEASAMEVPALVSDYTGCRETIIPNETGLYINKNPESIVNAVEVCLESNVAEQLGKNGRKFVQKNFEHTIVRTYMLNLLKSFDK